MMNDPKIKAKPDEVNKLSEEALEQVTGGLLHSVELDPQARPKDNSPLDKAGQREGFI